MSAKTPLIGAVDVGTTSVRLILFTKTGHPLLKHQIEYPTSANTEEPPVSLEGVYLKPSENVVIEKPEPFGPTLRFPEPGWVEVEPMHILYSVIACMNSVGKQLNALNAKMTAEGKPEYEIRGLGLTNMRETTVLFSKTTHRPVYNGIVWNDTRTSGIVARVKQQTPAEELEKIRRKCGLPLSTYFSAVKVRWILENCKEAADAYEAGDLAFATLDTWIFYSLTRERSFVTDVTNASRTMLMDIAKLEYDDSLLDFFKLDRKKLALPQIVSSSETYGHFAIPDEIHSYAYDEKDINAFFGVPFCGCLGDQSASMVGQLALRKGDAKNTYGTGCFLLYNTGHDMMISEHGGLTTLGYWFRDLSDSDEKRPCYALEGSIAVAGSVVQWLRDNLKLITKSSDVGPLASLVEDNGGVYFVTAFSGLFAPYWDSDARGTMVGLTQHTTAAHIARAAIESVCFQTYAILNAMGLDSGTALSSLNVDGGMTQSDEVMQIQADILGKGVAVKRMRMSECTALGAAIAAGLAKDAGVWTTLEEVKADISGGLGTDTFESKQPDDVRKKNYARWERAVERAKGWMAED